MMHYVLNNGVRMPMLNLGTYQIPESKMFRVLSEAKELGYEGLDSAGAYGNEKAIGDALNELGRDRFFITSKVDVRQFVGQTVNGRPKTVYDCFEETLSYLQTEYVDLYLVHWPVPEHFVAMWKCLLQLYADKRVKAIGVSNCQKEHIERLLQEGDVVPAFNQFERHPLNNRMELVRFCQGMGIQVCAHSPFAWGNARLLEYDKLNAIAAKYNKTIPQIIARWNLQNGVALCPKSVHYERLAENINVFDFTLSAEDMQYIDSLHSGSSVYDVKKKEVYSQLY